jgi:hypothetical protein
MPRSNCQGGSGIGSTVPSPVKSVRKITIPQARGWNNQTGRTGLLKWVVGPNRNPQNIAKTTEGNLMGAIKQDGPKYRLGTLLSGDEFTKSWSLSEARPSTCRRNSRSGRL